jgi:oxygen-independent coproporphyrinogen-3 oxidase
VSISTELLLKYDRPGPRYTSYPTAPDWLDSFGPDDFLSRLEQADRDAPDEPFSLYVHVPFCERLCLYCGCNVVITRKHEVAADYLRYLDREMDLAAERLPRRRSVAQVHLGGGTPTFLTPAELTQLHESVTRRFRILPSAEIAIEVDPRVTTADHVRALAGLGFNRVSMGIQDFDPRVQKAVHRIQGEEPTRRLVDRCREAGFQSINVDLMYGLPYQSEASYRRTLEAVLALRPDRVAVFNYAHVPWLKRQQGAFPESALPRGREKLELFRLAVETFTRAGYRQIGMDHFALPSDELAVASEKGTLHRNFQGYTVMPEIDTIAFGVSAISDVCGAYAQNDRTLAGWAALLEAGRPATIRGIVLDAEDRLRRHVIQEILCNFRLDLASVEARFGIRFREHFAAELAALEEHRGDGLVEVHPDRLVVTATGRLLVRNVCMAFDAHLRERRDDRPIFSRTI